jgi:hypothetical protein
MFELRIVFDTLEELQDFLNRTNERECITDKVKKLDDKRGQGTKAFHEKAKKYRTEHPNKTYRECLKELSDMHKNNINNNI